jgi:alpha-1,3-mannosyltransferase
MKVLQICSHFYPCKGGIERHVEDLCLGLKKMGIESDVLCLNTCAYSKEKFKAFEVYRGIRIFRVPYINLKFYKIAPWILNVVKRYDIVHVHGIGFFSDWLSLTKAFHKRPLVLSTHGGIFHTRKIWWLKKIYFEKWCRFILRNFDKIIAISKNDYELFSKITKNIVLIENWIDFEKFNKAKQRKQPKSFVFVGRLSRNKRADNLLKVFAEVKKYEPRFKLYVVGSDWEGILTELKFLAKRLGISENVVFVGEVSDKKLLEILGKARFFVSASEYEGFGISVIESMAAGCIPIVNNIEAFRHFVKNEKNGFIVDFSKPEKAAKKFYEIMRRRDLERIRKNAMKTAEKYDWKKNVKKLVELYEKFT